MRTTLLRVLLVGAALAAAGCAEIWLRQDFAAVEAPQPKVGDRWVYEVVNGYNNLVTGKVTQEVVAVTADRIDVRVTQEPSGTVSVERFAPGWNPYSGVMAPGLPAGWGYDETIPYGARVTYARAFPLFHFPLLPRQRWKSRVQVSDPKSGKQIGADVWAWVAGSGHARTPAGQFEAIKVFHDVWYRDWDWWRTQTHSELIDWYAPAVGNVVLRELYSSYRDYTRGRYGAAELIPGDYLIYRLVGYLPAQVH